MIQEMEKSGTVQLSAFYMRRLLRIWPLYFAWIAVLMLTRHLWSDYSLGFFVPFLLFGGNFAASLGVVTNIVILPLWSVSVEEQFYLLWPLLMRNLTRRGVIVAGFTIWIFTTVARFELLRAGMTPHQIWFIGFGRLGAIALGIILAGLPRHSSRIRGIWVVLGLICWGEAAACHLYRMQPEGLANPMLGFAMAAIGAAAFLFAAIGTRQGGILTNPVTVYLGRISYGLYVFHGAALVMASRLVPGGMPNSIFWPTFTIVGFVVAAGLSVASYRWIESPFLRMKKRYEVVTSAPVITAMAA
jgi:peptidoglycan/LPS O-acetylase OafA/YrhL